MDEHEGWRERVAAAGADVTPVIDRFYFRSIYFREPSGVLFEIATIGPGFAVDEPLESLGEKIALSAQLRAASRPIGEDLDPIAQPEGRGFRPLTAGPQECSHWGRIVPR